MMKLYPVMTQNISCVELSTCFLVLPDIGINVSSDVLK